MFGWNYRRVQLLQNLRHTSKSNTGEHRSRDAGRGSEKAAKKDAQSMCTCRSENGRAE